MDYSEMLFPACTTDNKNNLYYVTHTGHVIKKLDLKKGNIEYIDNPKGYNPNEWKGVDKLYFKDNFIYMFEQGGNKVLQYNILDKTSECYELDFNGNDCDNWAALTIYNNIMFVFLSYVNKIIKIDFKSQTVNNVELDVNINYVFNKKKYYEFTDKNGIVMPYKLYSCGCQINEDMWLFTEINHCVIKYNLSTEKLVQYHLPEEIAGCVYVVWNENIFFILDLEGRIYSWDFLSNKVKKIFDCKTPKQYPYFRKFVITNNNIWIIPFAGTDIYIVNLKDGKEFIFNKFPRDFCYCEENNRSRYYDNAEDTENYYFAMHSANYMLIIKKNSGEGYWLKPIEPTVREQLGYYMRNQTRNFDEHDWKLEDWIKSCANEKIISNLKKKLGTGAVIWDNIKG